MRLPSEMSLCFYRVAQEALNNVLRHSEAEQVFVTLSVSNGIAQLSIKDTGIGFDTSTFSQGIGLLSTSQPRAKGHKSRPGFTCRLRALPPRAGHKYSFLGRC